MKTYDYLKEIEEKYGLDQFRYLPSVVKDDVIQELEDKDLMLLIMKIMTLYLNYDDENAVFKPMLVWQDGSRSFDMSDLTDTDKDILSQIEYDLLPLPVRAQVCDLIWQTEKNMWQRKKLRILTMNCMMLRLILKIGVAVLT